MNRTNPNLRNALHDFEIHLDERNENSSETLSDYNLLAVDNLKKETSMKEELKKTLTSRKLEKKH